MIRLIENVQSIAVNHFQIELSEKNKSKHFYYFNVLNFTTTIVKLFKQ